MSLFLNYLEQPTSQNTHDKEQLIVRPLITSDIKDVPRGFWDIPKNLTWGPFLLSLCFLTLEIQDVYTIQWKMREKIIFTTVIAASEKNSVQHVVVAQLTVLERVRQVMQRLGGGRPLHCVIVSKTISGDLYFIYSLHSCIVVMIEL